MAKLTLQDVVTLAGKRRPWTFRMEDATSWWLATGRAKDEPAEIHTSTGPLQVVVWAEVERQAAANEAAGFDYQWTPFVKVSGPTIALHMARNGGLHLKMVGKDFWLADSKGPQRQLTTLEAQGFVQAGLPISW